MESTYGRKYSVCGVLTPKFQASSTLTFRFAIAHKLQIDSHTKICVLANGWLMKGKNNVLFWYA
ncbi:hypothetical protein LEP3755_54180 [Leptolyngbya sp. NIES-3755]|nr:hypothetical protein LEP3755_54180 [Leptolyngbya sp. NIES-3755]